MHFFSTLSILLSCSISLATATYGPSGKRTLGYFGNWDIYARNFTITDIPASELTHIIYAFMNINTTTGEVYLSDEYADLQFAYPGSTTVSNSTTLAGNLQQLYLLKKKNRSLKTMFSIGGYTYSPNFVAPLASPTMRATFARSAVSLMYNLGFDGIDVDYEYVTDSTQAAQLVDLLRLVREEMDAYAQKVHQTKFLLSFASPAGPQHYTELDFKGMDQYLDFWHFMAFDYAGSWDTIAGNQANLFGSHENELNVNTSTGVNYYTGVGCIPPAKINLGNPLYGRSFNDTKGPGTNFMSVGSLGSFGGAGVWDYKALPIPGFNAKVVEDFAIGASYSLDAQKGYMVSYDTPAIAREKARWVLERGLGGTMWWEVSMDKVGSESLIGATVGVYGGLESSSNHLSYPKSQYVNLRNGMPSN